MSSGLWALLEGYAVGLSLVVLIGPVLFVLMNATLAHGRASGLAVAFGIFLSDVLIVSLCYSGSAGVSLSPALTWWLSALGALLLALMGLRYLSAPPMTVTSATPPALSLFKCFSQGVAVNLINPFVFLVWFGIIGLARQRYPEAQAQVIYLSAVTFGILTLDVSKALLAHTLAPLLTPKGLKRLQRASGVALLMFSVRVLWGAL